MRKNLNVVPFFLALCLLTSLFNVCAFAASEPIEIGPHPGQNYSTAYSECENFDAVINQMIIDHRANNMVTMEELAIAKNIISYYNEYENTPADLPNTRSAFDDNWWKLRYGNLIELTLNYDEGLRNNVITACILMGDEAKDDASINFSNYWDSAQHFIWNFRMAKAYDKQTARVVGNNHEWGIAMINPMLRNFEIVYDEYIAMGYSDQSASNMALEDTVAYIPNFKFDSVSIMERSYAFFDEFFNDESTMDFWNNCYGRAYPEQDYASGISAFRYSAFTANELVLDGSSSTAENLTDTQKESVWSWDWYSY